MRLPLSLWLLFLSIPFLILSYSDHNFAFGQCLEDQKSLLLQLKHNLSSPSSKPILTTWDLKTDNCSWEGIRWDREGHVIGLDLYNKSISRVAQWSSLFELKYLISLNLSYNSFNSTPIPSGLDRLANLKYLNLSNSGFGGQIPIGVSRMKRLVILHLSTLFAAPLKLENPDLRTLVRDLSELKELYLDGVNISMRGIEWSQAVSSALPNLQVLSLSNCNLSGPLDPSLLKLQSLHSLRLDQNNISAPIPDFFGNFSNLSFIYLSGCGWLGKFPPQIFHLPQLKSLDVSSNPLLQGILPEFLQTSLLQNIVLSNTNFSGELPESIGKLRLLCKLEFTSCRFNGSIPSSMYNLTRLEYLDFSLNKFRGIVPYFNSSVNLTYINLAHNRLEGDISSYAWGAYLKLVTLNLRNNSLNGTVPSTLFSHPRLQKLDLGYNGFTGNLSEFPNGASLKLDTLDFSNNRLQGTIPQSIFSISSLKILVLSSNNLSGTLELSLFQNLRNLSNLDLSGNHMSIISGGTDSATFPQVSTLNLGSCNLRTIPDFLRNQSALNYLDLSNNQIQGKIPNWIWKIGNGSLTFLNLSSNSLQNPDQPLPADTFKSLAVVDLHSNLLQEPIPILPPSASVIDYSKNKISSSIPRNISLYLNVSIFFSLSGNFLKGEIPLSICDAGYLQVLDLSSNRLSGPVPACLVYNTTLRVLNLRSNQLNGFMPQTLQGKCSLRTLDLNGNKLAGQVPTTLGNCTDLEVLDLGNNQLNGYFPCWLGEMSNLRVLVLRSNSFIGSIPKPKSNDTFQKLQIIDLSSNYFTGNLPASRFSRWLEMKTNEEAEANHKSRILKFPFLEFSGSYYQDSVTVTNKGQQMELVKILTIFTSIDLSRNKFEGGIPEEIGSLKGLYVLNLSNNALTGSIPSSLGNLKQLESLDLSSNKLIGMIPSSLEDLTFLSALNLSFNQLVGAIPQDRQFQTFDPNVYEGNNRLCGHPLIIKCGSMPKILPSPSKTKFKFDWEFIVTGVGFGGGLAWIIAPLWFWTEGRKWFDKQFHKLLLLMCPSIRFQRCDDNKVDAITDESLDEELTDDEHTESSYSYDIEAETFHGRGRYCVFCTKIDISKGRVVHDPKCIHLSQPDSSVFQNSNL